MYTNVKECKDKVVSMNIVQKLENMDITPHRKNVDFHKQLTTAT